MSETSQRKFVRLFQPRFAELVQSGTKRQTIRKTPKRMPKAGDLIDCRMWSGKPYRSKQHHIRVDEILEVVTVKISEGTSYINGISMPSFHHEDIFAEQDGFYDFCDLLDWFKENHSLPFEGILIRW